MLHRTEKIDFIQIPGRFGRPLLADIHYTRSHAPQPLLIFCHGFKGFKDFAYFNQLAAHIAQSGIAVLKFNFSHNGTTPEHPQVFTDLDAFSHNTFSKEADDVQDVLRFISDFKLSDATIDTSRVYVMGHSRGGAIATVATAENAAIKKLVTLAAVSRFGKFFSTDTIQKWKAEGIMHVENTRTKQLLPMRYDMYEDYFKNENRLSVERAAARVSVPVLIIHGTADATVPVQMAQELAGWIGGSQLLLIENADHVLGGKHPWDLSSLPPHAHEAAQAIIHFLKQ